MKKDESFKKSDRVLKRGIFLKATRSRHARRSENFVVVELRDYPGEKKLGIVTTKKVGNAVKRNRVKRLIREFFRRGKDRIKEDTYYIVIAGRNSSALSYDDVTKELSVSMFYK